MDWESTPACFRLLETVSLARVVCGGALLVFGVLGCIQEPPWPAAGSDVPPWMLAGMTRVLAVTLILLGYGLLCYRRGVVLERATRRMRLWWGLPYPLGGAETTLPERGCVWRFRQGVETEGPSEPRVGRGRGPGRREAVNRHGIRLSSAEGATVIAVDLGASESDRLAAEVAAWLGWALLDDEGQGPTLRVGGARIAESEPTAPGCSPPPPDATPLGEVRAGSAFHAMHHPAPHPLLAGRSA